MKKIVLALSFMISSMFAHSAIMSCFDNADGTITCEGGFSDGSSATGVKFKVEKDGKIVFNTKMNEYSEVNFKKPSGDYTAIFDAGEGHQVKIKSSDITE
ncbi:hypothetical protein AMRN_1889 [Malaciobacter marinus]|nr:MULTISPECIES: hypothetical protein [Malaciobacter]AXX87616.1 hypothetical protein AMRN_1889 [Malaciobacter marinus]